MGFGGGIDDVADDTASQFAAGNFQFVRGRKIKAEFDAQTFGEIGKPTGKNGGAQASILGRFEEFAGAG
jgi:hypothetical protein